MGWREFPLFVVCFLHFLSFASLFFVLFRLSAHSPSTRASNCNLLENGEFHPSFCCSHPSGINKFDVQIILYFGAHGGGLAFCLLFFCLSEGQKQ